MSEQLGHLTSGRLLARNVVYNCLGLVAPLVIGLFAVPPLISTIGIERFGVLCLFWALIGYFALFDLGLGRAITNLVAESFGSQRVTEIPVIIWSGLSVMAVSGLASGALLAILAPWLVRSALQIPSDLEQEAIVATYILAATLPFTVIAAGLRGALEAVQHFGLIAIVRALFAAIALLGPLAMTQYSVSLVAMVAILSAGRFLVLGMFVVGASNLFPRLIAQLSIHWSEIKRLLRFGTWMTVSNAISPLMVNLDRFVLGAVVSIAAVTYYSTPFDVVTKLLVIPAAVTGVLFSALSSLGSQNQARAVVIYETAYRSVIVALCGATLCIVLFAQELLAIWISVDFAAQSYRVAQIIAVAVLVNGLAQLPFSVVQAAKRPDLAAKLHLIEFLPFMAILLFSAKWYGIEGVAWAWLIRATADWIALSVIAGRVQRIRITLRRYEVLVLTGIGISFALSFLRLQVDERIGILIVSGILLGIFLRPMVPQLMSVIKQRKP